MNKHYGQITKAYANAALISAVLLILCAGLFYFTKNIYTSLIAAALGVIMVIVVIVLRQQRKNSIKSFLEKIEKTAGAANANILSALPLPAAVAHIDGTVKWFNELFEALFNKKHLSEAKLESIIPEIKWGDLLKSAKQYEKEITIGDGKYIFIANAVKNKHANSNENEDKVDIYIYLINKTKEYELEKLYVGEHTDVAIITIDNYDDVIQRADDNEQQKIISNIRKAVNEWCSKSKALVKITDRDRYYVFFEHRFLKMYEDERFEILQEIRNIGEEMKLPISISIGVGTSGSLYENDTYARSALDMALGRGGDQASIKDDVQYRFYGSKARDYEKSTRVKTRAIAIALKDFIKNSDKVIFMGHSNADYDCFGAAIGLQRAVRSMGKKPYIIYDGLSPAIRKMYDDANKIEEYKGMIISPEESLEFATPDTLVIVLDTHRPPMLPNLELISRTSKIVLIDHHRRSTDFLNPCSLVYHEPYASSTCEMATELLEYMNLGGSLTNFEAECLYTGILMDTKNFIVKTGVRTFEAASYLRRLGLNTADTKKLFNVSKDDYVHRSDIVRTAENIADGIAVAKCYDKIPNMRVIASQASDEMLNISGITASIVVYPLDNGVGVSARSFGNVNVQVIMEALGGGGHSTVAGAQLKNKTINSVVDDVKTAVKDYLKNNEI